jgi:murein L,D-transpeptidase YcbB/YkuD
MQGRALAAVLVVVPALALAASVARPGFAEDRPAGEQPANLTLAPASGAAQPAADPSVPQPLAEPTPPADPVVAIIRQKLAEPALRKAASAGDLAALEAFYGERSEPPVWITDMGFTYQGQAAISEIAGADDWGLSAAAFDLPDAGALPAMQEAQAEAELKLALAILKYSRFARGGRTTPVKLSKLFDQVPALRDPKTVLAEISAVDAPDAYLQSLHPKHEQFERLRQVLLKARDGGASGKKKLSAGEVQRLIVNMERWRWMPETLGPVYVENNVPEFMLRVVKGGEVIHSDKIVVGKPVYATPVFSADMRTIVFNPEWIVPATIVREDLLPKLRGGGGMFGSNISVLRQHNLKVKKNGRTVDPRKIDWKRVRYGDVTFIQPPGPKNALGKLKFLYPNKHVVYMHDTIKKGLFKKAVRIEGHNCLRMEKPGRLAAVLLAEDKGWSSAKIDKLLAEGNNSAVSLDRPIPVHTTYFTARVDDEGKFQTFSDIYNLDRRTAKALFGKTVKVETVARSTPASSAGGREETRRPARRPKRPPPPSVAQQSIPGLFGN